MNFCINCGTKLAEGVSNCPNCGFEIKKSDSHNKKPFVGEDKEAIFAEQEQYDETIALSTEKEEHFTIEYDEVDTISEGTDVSEEDLEASARLAVSFFDDEEEDASLNLDRVKDKFNEATDKLSSRAQEILEKSRQRAADNSSSKKSRVQSEQTVSPQNSASTRYMSSKELWSWLKQNAKRQLFYTEEISHLSEAEFMDILADRLEENGVPAIIELKKIQWDRSSVNRSNYYVRPITDVVNPLSCMLQFSHVGKYTFVEEKTFITPPDLPKVEKKLPVDPNAAGLALCLIVFGVLLAIISIAMLAVNALWGLIGIAIGVFMAYKGYGKSGSSREVLEHNKRCEKQAADYLLAWKKWEDSIFIHSFQEDVNGQLSRINDAVFECIKQICGELFDEKPSVDKEENLNMNELEAQIARRKEEYR